MNQIKRLADNLINKIAAGEVVERPASVVKELLENSIDAQSTKIRVELEKGGSELIRVSDNGIGMGREDALLSIKRHYTSKILNDNDLFSINTLGFRGEALPSIASVSKLKLITREEASEVGSEIYIEGGKILNISDAGSPSGTMITINDLFYNVPARKKFLKSVRTELSHIVEIITNMSMCYPSIQFLLFHNKRELKNWPICDIMSDRISAVMGHDLYSKLYEINNSFGNTSVTGWISSPEISRNSINNHIFVNGRVIRDKTVQHAIFEGYRGRLMKGQYPVVVLFIELPFNEVDVNVHPSKNEVRFFYQSKIHDTVVKAIRNGLLLADTNPWNNASKNDALNDINQKLPKYQINEPQERLTQKTLSLKDDEYEEFFNNSIGNSDRFNNSEPLSPNSNDLDLIPENNLKNDNSRQLADQNLNSINKYKFSELIPIGQLHNTFIICESKKGMILLDQHAAHERILFEKIKESLSSKRLCIQKLLIPEIIDVNYKYVDILIKMLPDLTSLGIEIEHFGGNSFAVKAKPEILSHKRIQELIFEIIENVSESGLVFNFEKAIDECIEIMACHAAIRAGQKLCDKEIVTLLSQLEKVTQPSQCPHGRPTSIEWSIGDLEKKFKRII